MILSTSYRITYNYFTFYRFFFYRCSQHVFLTNEMTLTSFTAVQTHCVHNVSISNTGTGASLTWTMGSKVKAASSVSGFGAVATLTDSPGAPAAVSSIARRLLQEGRHDLLNHLCQHAERRLHDEVDESCRKATPFSLCSAHFKKKLLFFSSLSGITTTENAETLRV